MTAKQKRFVQEYVIDGNATQAAIRAGYSEKNAQSIGYQLLHKTPVAEALEKKAEKVAERAEISAAWVLETLKENIERAMMAVPVRDKDGREIGEFEWDGPVANKGLELAMRHLGMFPKEGAQINIDNRSVNVEGLTTEELRRLASHG